MSTSPSLRRAALTEQGEPLVVSQSPIETAIRLGTWLGMTGLTDDETLISPLVSVPLPVYPESWPAGHRRWPSVNADAMWHPLMWLPERVAHRYVVETEDPDRPGTWIEHVETDDEWAVRVALELAHCGLYDEGTGTWFDVLAAAGLDVEDEIDLARIEEWLAGSADPVLDSIDLSPIIDVPTDEAWAVSVAAAWVDDLRIITWATQADYLISACDDLADPDGPSGLGEFDGITGGAAGTGGTGRSRDIGWAANVIAALGMGVFARLEVAGGGESVETEDQFWSRMMLACDALRDDPVALIDGPVAEMMDHLLVIRETFWPQMEAIAAATRASLGDAGQPVGS